MITYEKCLSEHYLGPLRKLVYRSEFSSVAKVLEYAISDLIMQHVNFGHIAMHDLHDARILIKKGFYISEREFVRTAVREFLKREKLWMKKFS